jgi:hypothetical protein
MITRETSPNTRGVTGEQRYVSIRINKRNLPRVII